MEMFVICDTLNHMDAKRMAACAAAQYGVKPGQRVTVADLMKRKGGKGK